MAEARRNQMKSADLIPAAETETHNIEWRKWRLVVTLLVGGNCGRVHGKLLNLIGIPPATRRYRSFHSVCHSSTVVAGTIVST